MNIKKATLSDLDLLAPLFSDYLEFYGSDKKASSQRDFLQERLTNRDSTIFLACDEQDNGVGFTQVYPSFTSVGIGKLLVLNDLFVHEDHRGRGVGRALINAVKEFAESVGAVRFDLETGIDNLTAQRLYEDFGFIKTDGYLHYSYVVSAK